jgi:hypothetical protein
MWGTIVFYQAKIVKVNEQKDWHKSKNDLTIPHDKPHHGLEENWTSPRSDYSLLPAGCLHPPSRLH